MPTHHLKSEAQPNNVLQQGWAWCQQNLFNGLFNSALTIISMAFLLWWVPPLLDWAIFDANWIGQTRADCIKDGACWVFIKARWNQFVYGFYPEAELWRVNLAAGGFSLTVAAWFIAPLRKKGVLAIWTFVGIPLVSWILLRGGLLELPPVATSQWGGMFLTLLISSVGIVCSLPLGILLALGRRSRLPIIKSFSIIFIEFWRGVPLITVLFMSSVMLPLFMPADTSVDRLMRVLIGIALFSSAYMAEVVRGGLQSIPKGQYEAAAAMGLGFWQSTYLVIMPQALKVVIPGIVNTFIGLFKDTTLVAIVGMFDLLGIIQAAFNDPNWLDMITEGYVFAAIFYWIFCYGMSKYSHNLELRLKKGHS